VVVVVELDEVAGACDGTCVSSVGPVPHAIRTPASVVAVVAITSVTRSPRMVPYLPLSRRLR
jgi:hypothetical protein